MSAEPELHDGPSPRELAAECPGLRLAWTRLAAVPGPSPPRAARAAARGCRTGFGGAQAIALRRQPIPHAYRVFFRHIGLEPDEHRIAGRGARRSSGMTGGRLPQPQPARRRDHRSP